jgi:hypothetical protein
MNELGDIDNARSANLPYAVSIDAVYAAAAQCYLKEHDRWNQWMLFFFGIIAAVFLGWQQVKDTVPLWAACFLAGSASAVWLVASESMRASSWSWLQTSKEIETGCVTTAFTVYESHFLAYSRWRDFAQTMNLATGAAWRSVTRALIFVVALLTLVFFSAGIALLVLP